MLVWVAAIPRSQDFREEDREPITLDDLNSVRVPRGWLEKWAEEPFFNNAVKGCFVRLGIGMQEQRSIYKVCEIVQARDYPDIHSSLRAPLEERFVW